MVKVVHYFSELSLTELRIVIYPPSDHGVDLRRNVLQLQVIVTQDSPAPYFFPYLLARFLADGRLEHRKDLMCLLVSGSSRAKGEAKVIKAFIFIPVMTIAVFAIDNLRLFFVQFQLALRKPLNQSVPYELRLLLASAMTNAIIRIPFEGYGRIVYLHPLVKDIMQEQVG